MFVDYAYGSANLQGHYFTDTMLEVLVHNHTMRTT